MCKNCLQIPHSATRNDIAYTYTALNMHACEPELRSKEIPMSSRTFFELVIVSYGVAA